MNTNTQQYIKRQNLFSFSKKMFLLSLFFSTMLRSLRFVLQHTFSLLSFQMAAVDRELANLSEERQEKSRRLNLKRMQHVSTLQQLSK